MLILASPVSEIGVASVAVVGSWLIDSGEEHGTAGAVFLSTTRINESDTDSFVTVSCLV